MEEQLFKLYTYMIQAALSDILRASGQSNTQTLLRTYDYRGGLELLKQLGVLLPYLDSAPFDEPYASSQLSDDFNDGAAGRNYEE